MNSTDPHGVTSTTASSNGENKKKISTTQSKLDGIFSTRQSFTFRESLMFYISKNPSSAAVYQKMIQTCKLFFFKNQILVISDLDFERDGWRINEKPLDLDNLLSNVWITNEFRVMPDFSKEAAYQNVASSITQRIFRCDVKCLALFDQKLSVAELRVLISSAEDIFFVDVTVKENDGTIVGVEKIVEAAVKAKKIEIHMPPIGSVTSKTMKELVKVPIFCKLDYFEFGSFPEVLDIEDFYVYMKKNRHTEFYLDFQGSFISDAYKNRLTEINDEILATKFFWYKPIRIIVPGMSREKELKLLDICCKEKRE